MRTLCQRFVTGSAILTGCQLIHAACATNFAFAFAHASGANSLISVILEAGKRVNKSLR